MSQDEVADAVRAAVAEAVGVDVDEVTDAATLTHDLGAESIDLLDMLFRIERTVGVKIEAAELAGYIQGGIPDDEFGDPHEVVTARGLAQLKLVMPQIDEAALVGRLRATAVMDLFTTANLVQLVRSRLPVRSA
ncbi:acyl carrier protein [Actinocrispum wychmicini]|uniref:Acyl carrier protein n=1 Tax=Actinocrispum wychmicini TaxID=1213861 RepID=A0A4R2ILI3_9PSEU|nr:acyl carrier protein [Actinocrispum wychmicini]TCO44799.1 acyl carrier protein [Actinocrispum wychmicini]